MQNLINYGKVQTFWKFQTCKNFKHFEYFGKFRKISKIIEIFQKFWKVWFFFNPALACPITNYCIHQGVSQFPSLEQWDSPLSVRGYLLEHTESPPSNYYIGGSTCMTWPLCIEWGFPLYKNDIAWWHEWYSTVVQYYVCNLQLYWYHYICWSHDWIWPIWLKIAQEVYNSSYSCMSLESIVVLCIFLLHTNVQLPISLIETIF